MGRPPVSTARKAGRKTAKPAPATTNREMREASLQKLEQSAIACFLESGVKTTSVEHISARAGLTKGGFYFHFPKKEAMIAHIISRIETEYVQRSVDTASRADTAKDQLVALLHQQVAFAGNHRQEVALLVLMSLEFRNDGEIGQQIRAVYDKVRLFVRDVFQRGQRRGEFTDTLSAQSLAHFYIAVHDGFLMELVRSSDPIDGPELVRVFRETLLRGVLIEEAGATPQKVPGPAARRKRIGA
jgi:AcrR family transcriptional regulator